MSRLLAFVALAAIFLALAPGIAPVPKASAQEASRSGQPVPRFVTIGRSRVNMRQGPSTSHRILWEFVGQQGLPVEVVAETETWRQIRDPEGDLGWVHRSLLDNSRGVVIAGSLRALRRGPAADAQIIAYMEARVVARLSQCTTVWCQITADCYTGWVRHDEVWGVYPREVVN